MNNRTFSRRQFLQVAGFGSTAMLIAACQPQPTPTPEPESSEGAQESTDVASGGHPGEFTFIGGALTTLDSYLYTNGMYTQMYMGIKEGLVEFSPELGVQALQAESWELSDDGLTYTFHLRDNNQWYDGSPVTAHDYVAAIHYQLTPGRESKYSWDSPFGALVNAEEYRRGAVPAEAVGAEAIDDYTLRFTLRAPRPDFLNALVTGNGFPIHRGALEEFGDAWSDLENFQGNGPYMIETWDFNESVVLVPNPNYNLQRGNLQRITIRFSGKPLEAYEAGEIDFAGIGNVADLVVVQNDANLTDKVVYTETSGLEWLGFVPSEDGFLYDNPDVMKAIGKAVDVAAVVDSIWLGLKKATLQFHYPIQPGYDPAFDSVWAPNVAEAQQLLADAGYPNGEGVPPLLLTFPSYQNQDYVSTWTAIAAQIQENLGIQIQLNNLESGIYAQVTNGLLNPTENAGLTFLASGKPWQDPLFGFERVENVRIFSDSQTYNEWARIRIEMNDLSQGVTTAAGGSDEDFAAAIEEFKTLHDEALALYEEHTSEQLLRDDAERLFGNWIEAATQALAEAQGGGDRDQLWRDTSVNLLDAKSEVFRLQNQLPKVWELAELRAKAMSSTDPAEQVELAMQAYDYVLNEGSFIPLWLSQSVNIVQPFVQGLRFNPFWWGNPMYLKWVSVV